MQSYLLGTIAGGALALGLAGPVLAQTAPLAPVAPPLAPGGYRPPEQPVPEGVSVAERPRIDYLPIGGRLGSFFLYPSATVTGGHTDNLRANDRIRQADEVVTVGASAQLVSGFSRHSLRTGAWYSRRFHASHSDEDASEYGGSLTGRIDLPQNTVNLATTVERRVLSRQDPNSPNTARSPLAYDRIHGSIGASHTFNHLTVIGQGAVTRLRYLNVIDDGGAVLDQHYRNYTGIGAKMEVDYEVHPGFAVLARGSYTRLSYQLQPAGRLDRDSHGWQAEGGVRFELGRLVFGELRVGYLARLYDDPLLRDARGISFGGDVLWNASPLTSLRLSADRRVEEAASTVAAGNRVTDFGLSIEHELRRNVILTASAGYVRYSPLGPALSSVEWRGGASAKVLLSRRLALKLDYRHASRDSPDPDHSFVENAISLGLTLSL